MRMFMPFLATVLKIFDANAEAAFHVCAHDCDDCYVVFGGDFADYAASFLQCDFYVADCSAEDSTFDYH